SPADQAGLKVGDRIIAINGHSFESAKDPIVETVVLGKPGDSVRFTVERSGAPANITLDLTLGPPGLVRVNPLASQLLSLYPVLFLLVGLPVLFLRIDSWHAWLLVMLFAGFISGAPLTPWEGVIHPALAGFMLAYMSFFYGMMPAFFYFFFATF